jgi:pyruvate/2-oxoglutarate dehydrogenase complex dihydrolipoamide acyltransferase (E2) component
MALEAEDDDANTATTTAPATPEPEKWLNDVDKQGNETKEWTNLKAAISANQVTSLAEVRKYYKISKEIAAKLEALING